MIGTCIEARPVMSIPDGCCECLSIFLLPTVCRPHSLNGRGPPLLHVVAKMWKLSGWSQAKTVPCTVSASECRRISSYMTYVYMIYLSVCLPIYPYICISTCISIYCICLSIDNILHVSGHIFVDDKSQAPQSACVRLLGTLDIADSPLGSRGKQRGECNSCCLVGTVAGQSWWWSIMLPVNA